MGGLAHYLEREGLPTTQISLIRKHTEGIRPPRALAVPFELGRPFGAPDEPDFQRRVLTEALSLLARTDGPVLVDFPDAPPGPPADMEGWTCPVNLPHPTEGLDDSAALLAAVKSEIALLRPWYAESVKAAGGRHLDGLTDLDPDDIAAFIVACIDDPATDSPIAGMPTARAIKLATDDLKFFYYQAALARPARVADTELGGWFYGETLAGELFLKLRETLRNCDIEALNQLAVRALVPGHQAFRKPEI